MKGTITNCLAELIERDHGEETWRAIMARAQVEKATHFKVRLVIADIPDVDFMTIVRATEQELGMSFQKLCDAFGEYWCCHYAPKNYAPIVSGFTSAREMLLGLDDVHVAMTRNVPNARPPRFNYTEVDDRTIRMEYHSDRNLLTLLAGLARGVGTYFGEPLKVTEEGNAIRVEWVG
jgi:hypothetical protein